MVKVKPLKKYTLVGSLNIQWKLSNIDLGVSNLIDIIKQIIPLSDPTGYDYMRMCVHK